MTVIYLHLRIVSNYVICLALRRDNVIAWTLRGELHPSHHSLVFDSVKFSTNSPPVSNCLAVSAAALDLPVGFHCVGEQAAKEVTTQTTSPWSITAVLEV